MPVIAVVEGMLVMIYFKDHGPPHFHVEFGEFQAGISIATLSVMDGTLPIAKRRKLLEWAKDHQDQLAQAWQDVQRERKPRRIK